MSSCLCLTAVLLGLGVDVAVPFAGPSWELHEELDMVNIDLMLQRGGNDMESIFRVFRFHPISLVRPCVITVQ
jgi:hypothetical protein